MDAHTYVDAHVCEAVVEVSLAAIATVTMACVDLDGIMAAAVREVGPGMVHSECGRAKCSEMPTPRLLGRARAGRRETRGYLAVVNHTAWVLSTPTRPGSPLPQRDCEAAHGPIIRP